jgi:inorganic triphosphatase YgiF
LTVDLRGMKAALQAQAKARGVPVSVFIRDALAQCTEPVERPTGAADVDARNTPRVRLSLRLREDEARDLSHRARQAGCPLGAYVAGLAGTGAESESAEARIRAVAALTRSNAELSALRRRIAHLTALLRHGAVRAAQEYRQSLETLDRDVRAHLALASRVLADKSDRRRRQEIPHV